MNFTNFENICKKNNTTPTAIASKLGLSSGITTKWRNGVVPKCDVLVKLCAELNCSADYLLGLNGSDLDLNDEEQDVMRKFRRLNYERNIRVKERIDVYLEEQDYADKAKIAVIDGRHVHIVNEDKYRIKTAATCMSEGIKVLMCTICGEDVQEETIPKISHDNP